MVRLRQSVRGSLLRAAGRVWPKPREPFLRCLYCHWVFPAAIENLAAVLRDLQRAGTFVSTERCIDLVLGRAPIDGPYFHLSIDDGFKNNLTHAAPLLVELGIPAVVFVPSAFMDASSAP